MLWRALKDVGEGFYIDAGAFHLELESVSYAFSLRGWRGINIEPASEYHALFAARRPRDVNLPVALGAVAGTATFYELAGTGLSTLDPALADAAAARCAAVISREVEVTTLADICRQYAPPDIHFLKIDCEGSEKEVLAGADFIKFRPWIVVIEATFPGTQTPSHGCWEQILLDAGYRFAWFDGLNRFYVEAGHYNKLAPLLATPPSVFDNFVLPQTTEGPCYSEALPPVMLQVEERMALAQRCRDCDDVPKVSNAGCVLQEPDGTDVQVMHNGIKVPAGEYCGPWMTRLIGLCEGHHEPQEERVFHQLVPLLAGNATMLELGGNWSYYTAWFLQGWPQRRAWVLEPDPANRAAGRRTMELNGLHAEFIAGFAGAGPAAPAPFETERSGSLLLPQFGVPQILDASNVDILDILHCDIQGAEFGTLAGCRDLLLAGRVRWVFLSTHVYQISGDPLTHQRCLGLLRECGASIEAEHNPYESYSGDGLVVARFGSPPAGWQPVRISMARQCESLYREPVHDVAELLSRAPTPADIARRVVNAIYETILLRKGDEAGIKFYVDLLRQTGDAGGILRSFLTSAEFAGRKAEFEEAYFNSHSPPPAPEQP